MIYARDYCYSQKEFLKYAKCYRQSLGQTHEKYIFFICRLYEAFIWLGFPVLLQILCP